DLPGRIGRDRVAGRGHISFGSVVAARGRGEQECADEHAGRELAEHETLPLASRVRYRTRRVDRARLLEAGPPLRDSAGLSPDFALRRAHRLYLVARHLACVA